MPTQLDRQFFEESTVQSLFDKMGPTYDIVNLVSSFGFSEFWRWQCVGRVDARSGELVCDMMSGSGECWRYLLRRKARIASIDFSVGMIQRQMARRERTIGSIQVLCENALQTSIADSSVDAVVCAFGLKTLSSEQTGRFAAELHRILRPGGRFSLLEISDPVGWFGAPLFRFYVGSIIPLIGRACLGDIECYRMLGVYTRAFGSCENVVSHFTRAGLAAHVLRHFFGCATSICGEKPAAP
jgi:demethylmenaquinone methyltransferase / 2-methoxy-6-polyprenyl-1,4-benzoquinol methylase